VGQHPRARTLIIGTLARTGSQATVTVLPPQNITQYNVIAESTVGDPNNVVMLRAHFDSAQRGPGTQAPRHRVVPSIELDQSGWATQR
jgi:hypothetical protein